ncbi:MAG: HlyD family type I secretion periplasmic adaptor subunit [Pseudomonadota bacterium]
MTQGAAHAPSTDDIDAALPVEPAKAAQFLLYLIAGLVAATLVWASVAKLDRVTRGEGLVVPSNQLQEVQSLEGGIVKSIAVKAGDAVKRGDLLVRLDATQVSADYRQGQDGYNLLAARIVRLKAEAVGEKPLFPDALKTNASKIVADEQVLFDARYAEFQTARSVQQAKLEDAEASLAIAKESLALAEEELGLIKPLVDRGVEPKIELVRTRQRRATADGEMRRAKIAVNRARSELLSIEQAYTAAAADELTKAQGEMAGFAGELPALKDKIDRTDLRAPIDGFVNRVLVTTITGVVGPGQTVVELVPAFDTPLVKARIKPADIGFLSEGQSARVKLTAYDSAVYGGVDASIETISPDAIEDEKSGERYFEIWVRMTSDVLRTRDGDLKIMAGMAAEVDVLNGKRSVLAYLFKPLTDVQNKALQEN